MTVWNAKVEWCGREQNKATASEAEEVMRAKENTLNKVNRTVVDK